MKRKSKKPSDFKKKLTKSVFLYGEPNVEKRNILKNIQETYINEVNRFIRLIHEEESMLPAVINHARTSPEARAFEKTNRVNLTSGYSQSAFDMAMDHLSNRMDNIRHELYGVLTCAFTQSKVLFEMALTRRTKADMLNWADEIINNLKKQKKDTAFYEGVKDELSSMKDFDDVVDELNMLYACLSDGYVIPYVKHSNVRLVSTVFKLEKSENIKEPYVVAISNPFKKRNLIEVPIRGSKDALRRLEQYGRCNTIDFSIREDGSIKVTVPFEKKLKEPKISSYKGADVGIVDMLHTSDDEVFGTFQKCENFYKAEVEPSFADMNSIRNKKRCIKHFLKVHKASLSDDVIKMLRSRMDKLDVILRKTDAPYRKKRHYNQMQEYEIKIAVNNYIKSLHGDKSICTALEFLDITEVKKCSKKSNQYLSNFARGMLTEKLMAELNWHGYSYIQVEPAYTSQTCPVCGNVNSKNRDGKRFACTCCGYEDDADHVGALNIKERGNDKEIADIFTSLKYAVKKRHEAVKNILIGRHNDWWAANMKGCYI